MLYDTDPYLGRGLGRNGETDVTMDLVQVILGKVTVSSSASLSGGGSICLSLELNDNALKFYNGLSSHAHVPQAY